MRTMQLYETVGYVYAVAAGFALIIGAIALIVVIGFAIIQLG